MEKEDILKAISECTTVAGTKKLTSMVDAYEAELLPYGTAHSEHFRTVARGEIMELRNTICDLTFDLYFKERDAGKYTYRSAIAAPVAKKAATPRKPASKKPAKPAKKARKK